MFGKNFKYVLVLTALAWMTYTLPTVRAALQMGYVVTSGDMAAAVVTSSIHPTSSTATNMDSRIAYNSSIKMYATAAQYMSDSSIQVGEGGTVYFYGSPENFRGLQKSKDFSMAYFFNDKQFSCQNNDYKINPTWIMVCKANSSGPSKFYVEIYVNGRTIRSNVIQVNVSTQPSVAVLGVLSPNGGETLYAGKQYLVKWKTLSVPANATIGISLVDSNTTNTYVATGLANDGSELVNITRFVAGGDYRLRVFCEIPGSEMSCGMDMSDSTFKIVALPDFITLSDVTLGGEGYNNATRVEVKYSNNFSGCADLFTENGVLVNNNNLLFCSTSAVENASAISDTSGIKVNVGDHVKLCKINTDKLNVCSNMVSVSGTVVQTPIKIEPQITAEGFNYQAVVGQSFSKLFIADATVDWSLGPKGSFPPGLKLIKFGAFSGQIAGTPTAVGTYSFTVIARDVNNSSRFTEVPVTITVSQVLTEAVTPQFTFVNSQTEVVAGNSVNDDIGVFKITFKVTALNGDVYIPSFSEVFAAKYYIDKAGVSITSGNISRVLVNNSDPSTTISDNWLIKEGSTETFTLTVSVPMGGALTAGQYRVSLGGVRWGVADDSDPESITEKGFENFKTNYQVLNRTSSTVPAGTAGIKAPVPTATKTPTR